MQTILKLFCMSLLKTDLLFLAEEKIVYHINIYNYIYRFGPPEGTDFG